MEPGFARIPRAWNGWAGIGSRSLTPGPQAERLVAKNCPDEGGLGRSRAEIWGWSIRLASLGELSAVFLAPVSAGRDCQMTTV
jgi:hypothetical protein